MPKIETYKDLRGLGSGSAEEIPKLIFRTGPFLASKLPKSIKSIYQETLKLNPGYRLIYFDHKDRRRFVKENYEKEYLDCYDALRPQAYKADYWRYLVLLRYGGCYGDFSQRMLVSYDSLCKGVKQVLCKEIPDLELGIYNAFICTSSKSPLISKVVEICTFNIRNRVDRRNIAVLHPDHCSLQVTGPLALGLAYFLTKKSLGKIKFLEIVSKTDLFIRDHENKKRKIAVRKSLDHFKLLYPNRRKKHYGYYWETDNIYN